MDSDPSRRARAVAADLRDRGFDTERTDGGALATGDGDAPFDADPPLAVVEPRDGSPLAVVSRVASAAADGATPLLVGDPDAAARARDVLGAPFALRGVDDGRRRFYGIPDRIRLTDGAFACVRGATAPTWRAVDDAATDSPALVLTADGESLAVLDGVAALACPGPSPAAFRYRYRRGEDGRFEVLDGDGVVGRYTGVGAMRADGFTPVDAPLVPEHHVRSGADRARATVLAAVDDDVTYLRP